MRCRGSHGLADPAYQSRSLLWLATRCTVLRSRWCQKQVDSASPSPLQVSLVRQSLRGGSARAIRHGDDGVEGLIASFLATTASSSARSFPFLCEPPLLECPLTFLHRTS